MGIERLHTNRIEVVPEGDGFVFYQLVHDELHYTCPETFASPAAAAQEALTEFPGMAVLILNTDPRVK